MDLSLTESQEMLKTATRELVEREFTKESLIELDSSDTSFASEGWNRIQKSGWAGMLIPERYGGAGSSFSDAAVVAQELGRGPVPGPFLGSAILGVLTILETGNENQLERLLPNVASGEIILGIAITEPQYGWDPQLIKCRARKTQSGYELDGTKLFALDLDGTSHVLCAAVLDDNSVGMFMIDIALSGVSIRKMPGFIAGASEMVLKEVQVKSESLLGNQNNDSWKSLEKAITKAIPILCAYQVGACEQVFETTLEYSNTRVQFGVPVGRFQRVQDHIIDMINHLDAAKWTTNEALWKIDSGKTYASSIHMAKAVASEAYYQVCNSAHEVHAGMGVMREYGLTLHTKMSRTLYDYLGDPILHKRRLGDILSS